MSSQQHIVIIGGRFGGLACAIELGNVANVDGTLTLRPQHLRVMLVEAGPRLLASRLVHETTAPGWASMSPSRPRDHHGLLHVVEGGAMHDAVTRLDEIVEPECGKA